MNDNTKAKRMAFYDDKEDFGSLPADRVLTTEERKVAAILMAVNAAMIQFTLEGLFEPSQSMHFMAHLQDFANRLYKGDSVKFSEAFHTLKVDSQAGQLFAASGEDALVNGSANLAKYKSAVNELAQQVQSAETKEGEDDLGNKPTLH